MATRKDSSQIPPPREEDSSAPGGPGEERITPTGVPMATLAKMLGVDEQVIRGHIDEGLPANADGTISLVVYAAWLISQQQ